ncbi:hypothetical protein NDY24_03910 [Xanthomonas hortorum pv. pelargonii]|nr:hypothetical protein NDY24_03910 [Xanthomonas hortorum pv. pelargonii]
MAAAFSGPVASARRDEHRDSLSFLTRTSYRKASIVKHSLSTVLFSGMLMLSLQPSTAFGQDHSPQSAKCPEPGAVHYDAAHYRAVADVEFPAGSVAYGRGDWVSTKQPDQGVPIKLSSVLFYGKQPGKSKQNPNRRVRWSIAPMNCVTTSKWIWLTSTEAHRISSAT